MELNRAMFICNKSGTACRTYHYLIYQVMVVLLCLLSSPGKAQGIYNYLSYDLDFLSFSTEPPRALFADSIADSPSFKMALKDLICSPTGTPQFIVEAVNNRIYNKKLFTMMGTNNKLVNDFLPFQGFSASYGTIGGVLPQLNDSFIYVLNYKTRVLERSDYQDTIIYTPYYHRIHIHNNNDTGQWDSTWLPVIVRNDTVLTAYGNFALAKIKNENAYLLIYYKTIANSFYLVKYDSSGFHYLREINLETKYKIPNYTLQNDYYAGNSIGNLRFSKDAKLLVSTVPATRNVNTPLAVKMLYPEKGYVYAHIFNPDNGDITASFIIDSAILKPNNYYATWYTPIKCKLLGKDLSLTGFQDVAFSPNDSFIYVTFSTGDSLYIFQYERYNGFEKRIVLKLKRKSRKDWYSCNPFDTITYQNCKSNLRTGPNGKIYFNNSDTAIGCIVRPNNKGTLCKVLPYMYSKSDTGKSFWWNDEKGYLPFSYYSRYVYWKNVVYNCNNSFTFTNASDSGFQSYIWYFGDGDSMLTNQNIVSHTYRVKGNYLVRLKGIDEYGYGQWYSDSLYFPTRPKSKIWVSSTQGCQYVKFQFTDSSDADTGVNNQITHYWDFGDGTDTAIVTGIENMHYVLNHIYHTNGTFTVRLIINNGFCADTFTYLNDVIILPAPKPGFICSSTNWCAKPCIVTLTAKTAVNVVRYFYNMGNGDTISATSPTIQYTYTAPGEYTIIQKILGNTGCITEDSLRIRIRNGITTKDTVNVLYSTVIDNTTTRTVWESFPNATMYEINGVQLSDTFYEDTKCNTALRSYDYTVYAIDSCGNKSAPSATNRTILLAAQNMDENGYALLSYSTYDYWTAGVKSYIIDVKQKDEWIKLTTVDGTKLKYSDTHFADSLLNGENASEKCYKVTAIENAGNNQISKSNIVCVPYTPVVFIPTAFSPNNDGLNDMFTPVFLGLSYYSLRVYNRWGQEVYSTSNTNPNNGWDGTINGEEAEAGLYIWVFSATSILSNTTYHNPANAIEKRGTLYLIR